MWWWKRYKEPLYYTNELFMFRVSKVGNLRVEKTEKGSTKHWDNLESSIMIIDREQYDSLFLRPGRTGYQDRAKCIVNGKIYTDNIYERLEDGVWFFNKNKGESLFDYFEVAVITETELEEFYLKHKRLVEKSNKTKSNPTILNF